LLTFVLLVLLSAGPPEKVARSALIAWVLHILELIAGIFGVG